MKFQRFNSRVLSENCYALSDGGACVIVDPGFYYAEEVDALLSWLGGTVPDAILLTHGHFDHTMGIKRLRALWPEIPVYMHPADEAMLQEDVRIAANLGLHDVDFSFAWTPVSDGQTLVFGGSGDVCDCGSSEAGSSSDAGGSSEAGGLRFKVIATPGHSPGGVCWYCERLELVFTGDSLFAGTIGRTDFAYGDYDSLIRSIMEKLLLLPGSADIYPGHGYPSTIARERESNPFLEPFNEPEESFDPDLGGIEIHPL